MLCEFVTQEIESFILVFGLLNNCSKSRFIEGNISFRGIIMRDTRILGSIDGFNGSNLDPTSQVIGPISVIDFSV